MLESKVIIDIQFVSKLQVICVNILEFFSIQLMYFLRNEFVLQLSGCVG